jgi:hypothetical protein
MIPKIPIDDLVPPAIVRDVARVAGELRAKGGTHLVAQVPADDLAGVMNALAPRIGHPFSPTLCGLPVMPYEGAAVSVMGRQGAAPKPMLYGADGSQMELA